jgi:PPP family 3-phenylpropionic acid transporter
VSTRVPALSLAAFYFAYLAALGAYSPYFPLFLAERGLSPLAISAMLALWYGTRIVSPSVWGHLTANAARPVRWLRIGAVLTTIVFAGFALELPASGIVLVMFGFSFFYNAIMPQFEAVTLSHLAGEPARYGRIRVWGSIGFVLSVLAVGPLLDRIGVAALPLVMLPMFAAMIVTTFLNDYGPAHAEGSERESLAMSLARPGVRSFLAVILLMQIAHGPYYVYFSLFLAESGYRPGMLAVFWSIGVGAEIVMLWYGAHLIQRFGAVVLIRIALATAAVRFALTALFPSELILISLVQLAHAFTFALFHASCMHRAARLFPGRLQGQGQGLIYGIGSGLGGVIGALLAGAMWSLGGGRAAFLLAAVSAATGLFLALRFLAPGDPATRPRNLPMRSDEAS